MNQICYIYKILCLTNGKIYIGSTNNFENRKKVHLKSLRSNNHTSRYLQNAYNKYVIRNFEFYILEHCDSENRWAREQFYIDSLQPEFNVSKNAFGGGTFFNEPWNKGKKMSNQYKENVSKGTKKAMQDEFVKQKQSQSMKGRTPWNKGNNTSEETKLKQKYIQSNRSWNNKISESKKGKPNINERKEVIRYCSDSGVDIKYYCSTFVAAEDNNIKSERKIQRLCRLHDKGKITGFKYKN
jgi:group I intron endonuclease